MGESFTVSSYTQAVLKGDSYFFRRKIFQFVNNSTFSPWSRKKHWKVEKAHEERWQLWLSFLPKLAEKPKRALPKNYKDSKYHLLAMLLDPRFNYVLVKNESQRTRKKLLNFIKSVSITRTSCSSHELDIETSLDGSGSVWDAFDAASKRQENKSSADHDTDLTLEIDAYFSQTIIQKSKNPLEFWNLNKLCFPKLAEAARIVLAIPATAAPSERVWSDAGNIVTDARQNVSPTNFRKLFLRQNLKTWSPICSYRKTCSWRPWGLGGVGVGVGVWLWGWGWGCGGGGWKPLG